MWLSKVSKLFVVDLVCFVWVCCLVDKFCKVIILIRFNIVFNGVWILWFKFVINWFFVSVVCLVLFFVCISVVIFCICII